MAGKTTRLKTKSPAPSSQPCKRRGRPPKAKAQVSATATAKVEAPTQNVAKTESDESTADIQTEYETTDAPVTPFECRRSARRKVTKFEVLNLLKKNRKTNKNQADSCQNVNDSNTSKIERQETTAVDIMSTQSSPKQTKCQIVAGVSVLPQDSRLQTENCSKKGVLKMPRVLLKDVAKYGVDKANAFIPHRIRKSKTKNIRQLRVRIKRMRRHMPTSSDDSDKNGAMLSTSKLDAMDLAPEAESTLKTAEEKQMEVTEAQTKRQAETEAQANIKTEPLAILPAKNVDTKPHTIQQEIQSTQPANPYEASSKPNRIVTDNVKQQPSLETPSLCPNSVMIETTIQGPHNAIEKMSASPVSSEQRRRKRSCLRAKATGCNSGKLTLEEIFAEIVAKSTNSILKTDTFESKNITGNPQKIDLIDHNNSNRNMDVDLDAHFELESVKQVPSNDVPLDLPKVVKLETLLETKQQSEEEILLQSEMETLQEAETDMVQQETESLQETLEEAETVHEVLQEINIKLEAHQETEQLTKKLQAETEQKLESEPLPGTFTGPQFLQEMESQQAEAVPELVQHMEMQQETQQATEMLEVQDELVQGIETDQEMQQETELLNEPKAEFLPPMEGQQMETAEETQEEAVTLFETVSESVQGIETEQEIEEEAKTLLESILDLVHDTETDQEMQQEIDVLNEQKAEFLPPTETVPESGQEMEMAHETQEEAETLFETVSESVQGMETEQEIEEEAKILLETILDLVHETETDQEMQQEIDVLNEQKAESLPATETGPELVQFMETQDDPKTLLETVPELVQGMETEMLNERNAESLPATETGPELVQFMETQEDPKTPLETVPELVRGMEMVLYDEEKSKETEMLNERNAESLPAMETVPESVQGMEVEQEKPQESQQEAEMLQEPVAVILPEVETVPKLELVMGSEQETEMVQELPELLQEMKTEQETLQETEMLQKQETESLSDLLQETQQKTETLQEMETEAKAMTLQKTEQTLHKMAEYVEIKQEPQQIIGKETQAQAEIEEETTSSFDTKLNLAEPNELSKSETPKQEMKLEEIYELPEPQVLQPSEDQLNPADAPLVASIESMPLAQPDVEVALMLETLLSQVESTVETNPSTSQPKKRAIKKLKLNAKRQNAKTTEISSAEKPAEDHPLVKSPENSSTTPLNSPPADVLEKTEPESESERKHSQSKRKRRKRKSEPESQSSQQSSEDSNSSGTQGAKKRKSCNQRDELQLCLIETESSESTSSGNKIPNCGLPTPTAELDAQYPLKNMNKFIENGVKLLKQQKVEEEKEQPKKPEDEFAQRVANMETPATTPSTSPQPQPETESQPEVVPTEQEQTQTGGVRRSHRIRKKPQLPKTCPNVGIKKSSTSIGMAEQLAELAQIEAINEQFLRNEGLNTFQSLRDNYYRCARQVSQENAEMQCDCLLNGDDESLGQLYCGSGCINRMLMIECGPLCSNGTRCTNKRFQQHQCWPCRVFRTDKKGCGITAELEIPPGQFIMEYVGEVIDSETFEHRQHLYSRDRNRHYYFMALRGEAIIDATAKGNISRYINHSCSPNAETQKWTVNGELRIGFFSLKRIQAGEEITFDYQYQRYGRDAQRCYCESSNCRGWIGGEPDSDEGEQQEEELQEQEQLSDSEPEELPRQRSYKKAKLSKTKSSQQKLSKLPSSRKQRKEQSKYKDREYRAGRWLRPSKNHARHKADTPEDVDVLRQLTLLNRSGLKNQADTLGFSRCMVRAKLLPTRLQLLGVLTRGETPCRRLFLDYHGLRLLHGWISESGSDKQLRLALLEALESLPIPNRSMLNDSRVYQAVQLWSSAKGESKQVHQRMLELLKKWDSLPEIFRIPKRERIEQMQEHENETDGQDRMHYAVTALEESNSNIQHSDRYRQDRFRRDTCIRYDKSKPVSWASVISSLQSVQHQERRASMDRPTTDARRSTISKELRRSLFEQKVAKNQAEKRLNSEEQREHEERCKYFGADPSTDPKQLPFYENRDTKEWFNKSDQPVPAPLLRGNENDSESPEADHDAEYTLPPTVEPLPPSWHWATADDGSIYYFNVRNRIPQWEPPNAQQRLEKLADTSSSDEEQGEKDPMQLISIKSSQIRGLSPKSLKQFTDDKVRERRDLRRQQLVTVREISPRREADRLGSLQESRRYQDNKEKIRRRKQFYRQQHNPDMPSVSHTLAIPRYLYSSDENEEDIKSMAQTEALQQNKSFQLPKHEANTNKSTTAAYNKPKSPPAEPATETPPETAINAEASRKRKLSTTERHKSSHTDREKRRKLPESSTANDRDACDKFLSDISGHVAEYLRPFRKESCQLGYITCDEDYKFLINRLSQYITTKETRYCDTTRHLLACTESVRKKSYEYVNQYMRKKGAVYKRPQDQEMDN